MTWRPAEILSIHGSAVPRELAALRAARPSTGLIPIVLGPSEAIELIDDNYGILIEDGLTVAGELASAANIDAEEWLAVKAEDADMAAPPMGGWPFPANLRRPKIRLGAHLDVLTNRPHREVFLGLFRVDHPWQALGHMLWSSFNYAIGPAQHMAMQRYWAEGFGAEVVSATGDVIECHVARPPQNKKASMALAMQQYLYCPDIVDQGMGTISDLAATLLDSDYWYFWWD